MESKDSNENLNKEAKEKESKIVQIPLLVTSEKVPEKEESKETIVTMKDPKTVVISLTTSDPVKHEKELAQDQDENKKKKLAAMASIEPKRQTGWKKYLGLGLTIIAAMQFSLSALIIKVLDYHPFNLGVWRFLVMVIIPIPFLIHAVFWKKQKVFKVFWPMNSTLFYLGVQAVVGSNSLVLLFYAIQKLNLADALVISTSAPVFVTLLAWVFLGEKAGFFPFFTAVLTMCGVGIICRPPIITGAASYDDSLMYGAMLSFGSMLCLATCYVVIRYLRTMHHAMVNLCFSAWGFGQSLLIAYLIDVLALPQTWMEVVLIIATAVLAFFAQTCITLALKYEQAGPVSLVRSTEIIWAFVWQLIFLGVFPDVFSLVGAAIVVFAVVLTAVRKMISSLPDDHKYKRIFKCLLI